MLITFSSKHSPDIVMFGDIASTLLRAMGEKELPPGILRGDDLNTAAAKLRSFLQQKEELAAEQAAKRNAAVAGTADGENDKDDEARPQVALRQRALPLLDMLDTAHRHEDDVIWR